MRAFVILAVLASAAVAADKTPADPPKKEGKKVQELKVAFGTPTPGYKAAITEARAVGKELWVRVDVTAPAPGGIRPAVLGKVEATAEVESDLTPKYYVFGKTWKWKDEKSEYTYADELDKEAVEKWEKAWKDGKVVYEAKKKDDKKDK